MRIRFTRAQNLLRRCDCTPAPNQPKGLSESSIDAVKSAGGVRTALSLVAHVMEAIPDKRV